MSDENSIELPKYTCTKQVWALKIKEIKIVQNAANGIQEISLVPENDKYDAIPVTADFYWSERPFVGSYYIIDSFGAKSIMTASEFEFIYSEVSKEQE